jgi:hypothetical protein
VDAGGDDRYFAGEFSGGAGYFYGFGVLHDRGGDDCYRAASCSLGSGAHRGVGVLLDDAGCDRYLDRGQSMLGAGYDLGVGTLVDGGGDDRYLGARWCLGSGAEAGLGVLVDLAGGDQYRWITGLGLGQPHRARSGSNLGVWLDLGPVEDRFDAAEPEARPGLEPSGAPAGPAPCFQRPRPGHGGGHGLAWDCPAPLAEGQEPGGGPGRATGVDVDPPDPGEDAGRR